MSAKPSRRSCAIDEREYNFISFKLEKLRSALATVTGNVQNRICALPSSGIDDKISHDRIRTKISLTDSHLIISKRNSRQNNRTSKTKSSPKSLE